MTVAYGEDTAYPYSYPDPVGAHLLASPVMRVGTAYAPLDYATHPIDLIDHPLGWGWVDGPWSPVNFVNPANDVDLGYGGSNVPLISPPYDVTTLFSDPSMDRVANVSLFTALTDAVKKAGRATSATIGNRGGGNG